jgi:Subtilase family
MKILSRVFFAIVATLAVGQSLASGIIVRVQNPSTITDLTSDYTAIVAFEQAGQSPFFRLEVTEELSLSLIEAFEEDERIIWAEEEDRFSFRENNSSHGSSVAAIFDQSSAFELNSEIFQQINFVPIVGNYAPIRVGIVDTGVSFRQPSILGNVIAGASFIPGSITMDDSPSNLDSNFNGIVDEGAGHGTMIAGIILQLAPNSPLVVAKSADSDGNGNSWSVIQGVVFCVENQSKVINLSLGSSERLAGFSGILGWVENRGAVIVSPIGNESANMTYFPAGYSKVVCVSGLMPDNTKAPFSNWHYRALVAAPGSGVLSAWHDGGSAVWSGTSLSAPLVSGCLAAALVIDPNRRPREIREALRNSGQDINSLNPLYRDQLGRLLDFGNFVSFLKK